MRRAVPWMLAGVAAAFWALSYIYLTLPDVRPLALTNPDTTAFIELRAGEARRRGRRPLRDQRWVRYDRISPHLRRAVIVAEDSAFWQHTGIDLKEIRASFETNVARGRMARGGSTITQQLAKNLYLSPSRNPLRKLKEAVTAYRLEAALGKRRILELYLNVAELGDEVWGVEAASRRYWGTSAAALSTAQGAALAATLPSPLSSNPSLAPARMQRRQRAIIRRLGRGGVAVPPPDGRAEVTDPVSKATDSRSF